MTDEKRRPVVAVSTEGKSREQMKAEVWAALSRAAEANKKKKSDDD